MMLSLHFKGVVNFSTMVLLEAPTDLNTHLIILGCVSNISLLMTECVAPETRRNVFYFPSTVSVCVGIWQGFPKCGVRELPLGGAREEKCNGALSPLPLPLPLSLWLQAEPPALHLKILKWIIFFVHICFWAYACPPLCSLRGGSCVTLL